MIFLDFNILTKSFKSVFARVYETVRLNFKVSVLLITGILRLASGVVDLLQHYFPESFDRLPKDCGLFDGPKPTVLESCSVSDLAILLRGNKRKTQPIEFGAHQVCFSWLYGFLQILPALFLNHHFIWTTHNFLF